MVDVIDELKIRARVLHKRAAAGEPRAIARVRALGELRALPDEELAGHLKRRHCLALIARELGFEGWSHAVHVLGGAAEVEDFGTLLYPETGGAYWNIWSASYEEARAIRAEHGGYLLAYRHQYFIVDRYFIESLGLDPDDPDWERLGRDWVRPKEPAARARLYDKLIRARTAEAAT